jgi:hypothetical protein
MAVVPPSTRKDTAEGGPAAAAQTQERRDTRANSSEVR